MVSCLHYGHTCLSTPVGIRLPRLKMTGWKFAPTRFAFDNRFCAVPRPARHTQRERVCSAYRNQLLTAVSS